MADVNEWMRERGRKKDVNHPLFFFSPALVLSFWGWKMRVKKKRKKEKERKKIAGLLWSGLEMTVELNAGWETASSVRLLVKEITVLPSSPLLHGTQRLRLTRTYQVISGQADLPLSSLLPGPFFFSKHFLLSLPRFPSLLSSLISSSFVCHPRPRRVDWEVLRGVMCAELDPGDHKRPGSGHPLAPANSSIPCPALTPPAGALYLWLPSSSTRGFGLLLSRLRVHVFYRGETLRCQVETRRLQETLSRLTSWIEGLGCSYRFNWFLSLQLWLIVRSQRVSEAAREVHLTARMSVGLVNA